VNKSEGKLAKGQNSQEVKEPGAKKQGNQPGGETAKK